MKRVAKKGGEKKGDKTGEKRVKRGEDNTTEEEKGKKEIFGKLERQAVGSPLQ